MSGAAQQQAALYQASANERTQDYLRSLQRKGQEKLERLLEAHGNGLGGAISNEITKALTGKTNSEILGQWNKKAFEKAGQLAKKGFKSGKKALDDIQNRINARRAEAGQDDAGIGPDGSMNMRADTYGRDTRDLVRRRAEQGRDGLGSRPDTDHYEGGEEIEMGELSSAREPEEPEASAETNGISGEQPAPEEEAGGAMETGADEGVEEARADEGEEAEETDQMGDSVTDTGNEEARVARDNTTMESGEGLDTSDLVPSGGGSIGGSSDAVRSSTNMGASDLADLTGGTPGAGTAGDILPSTGAAEGAGAELGASAGAGEAAAGEAAVLIPF